MKSQAPEKESNQGRRIGLIITDLGGTLVKTDEAIMAAVRRAAGELGIPAGYTNPVYDVFGTSIWEYIHAYLPEGHKDRTNDCHKLHWRHRPRCSPGQEGRRPLRRRENRRPGRQVPPQNPSPKPPLSPRLLRWPQTSGLTIAPAFPLTRSSACQPGGAMVA